MTNYHTKWISTKY